MIKTKADWERIKTGATTWDTIPMEAWFCFYREKGGYLQSIEEFSGIFTQMMTMMPIFRTKNNRITPDSAIRNLFAYYETKTW